MAVRQFVTEDDLSVVFQPIVDLRTGELYATEALVRCSIPDFSYPPALFQHAVAARCCGRLGRMIRELAAPRAPDTALFVNIHPHELSDRWLVRPDDPIYRHGRTVYLEVTESVPITHYELCMDVLAEIRSRADVHLVVDDLGAGYSNLKRIADLEPRVVKLDRELISGLDRLPRLRQLVASVIRLCTEFGATVVAEGIETGAEYSALCDAGAHYGQGYLFAKPSFPMPAISWPPVPAMDRPQDLGLEGSGSDQGSSGDA